MVEAGSKEQHDRFMELDRINSLNVQVESRPHPTFNTCTGVITAPDWLCYEESELQEWLSDQKVIRVFCPKARLSYKKRAATLIP